MGCRLRVSELDAVALAAGTVQGFIDSATGVGGCGAHLAGGFEQFGQGLANRVNGKVGFICHGV